MTPEGNHPVGAFHLSTYSYFTPIVHTSGAKLPPPKPVLPYPHWRRRTVAEGNMKEELVRQLKEIAKKGGRASESSL